MYLINQFIGYLITYIIDLVFFVCSEICRGYEIPQDVNKFRNYQEFLTNIRRKSRFELKTN